MLFRCFLNSYVSCSDPRSNRLIFSQVHIINMHKINVAVFTYVFFCFSGRFYGECFVGDRLLSPNWNTIVKRSSDEQIRYLPRAFVFCVFNFIVSTWTQLLNDYLMNKSRSTMLIWKPTTYPILLFGNRFLNGKNPRKRPFMSRIKLKTSWR